MATPRAAAKRSGSSRDKWLFTGMDQIHATIPLEILKPLTGLFELGHTRFAALRASASGTGEPGATAMARQSGRQERRLVLPCPPCGREVLQFAANVFHDADPV